MFCCLLCIRIYVLSFSLFLLIWPDGFFQKHSVIDGVTLLLAIRGKGRPWCGSMWHTQRDFFRQSSHPFFGPLMFRWPKESSPYSTTVGRWWSSILATCPTQRRCDFNSGASRLMVSVCTSTSIFVVKSLQWMLRMVRRHCWWKCSSRRSWWWYSTYDSEPYRRVVTTTARYTLILVPLFMCLFFHTLLYSLPKALFAFARLLLMSLPKVKSDEMVQPRYVNCWTDFSSVPTMVMHGGWYSCWCAGWWRTTVFFTLISSSKSLAASAKQDVTRCRVDSEWATRAASSAKSSSLTSCWLVLVWAYSLLRLNRLPSVWYWM